MALTKHSSRKDAPQSHTVASAKAHAHTAAKAPAKAAAESAQKNDEDETPPLPFTPKDEKKARFVREQILFAFAVVLALLLGWRLRHALGIIYVSALFAVVLMPVVQQIMRLKIRGWQPSRTIAVITLVLFVFTLLGLGLALGLPPILRDVQHFASDLPHRIAKLSVRLHRFPWANRIGVDNLVGHVENAAGSFAQYMIASAPKWLGRIVDLLTAMVLCIYFMLEGEFAYFYLLSLFPEESRDRLARTLLTAEHRMSKWLLGQSALMLILGVTSTIVFASLHVRYFLLLGVLMGLFNLIPVVGGLITILFAAGVAAMDSWTKMAGVLIFYAIYTQVENVYLTPRIMKTSVNLIGLGVLIALLCGTELAGVVGAMVSVPTAALVAVLVDEYIVQKDADALAAEAAAKSEAT